MWQTIKSKWSGMRTLILSGLLGPASLLLAFGDQIQELGLDWRSLVGDVIPVKYVGWVIFGIVLLYTVLRIVTTTPIFTSAQPAKEPV